MKDPAFYEVIDSYYGEVKRFVAFLARDQWVANDVCQETFIRAQARIGSVDDGTKIKSWLFRIAHNCYIDYLRKQPKVKNLEVFEPSISETYQQTITPAKNIELAEMNHCIQQKMTLLPPHYKAILWLADGAEFSYHEIGDILNISQSNVKARLHRARKKFKDILTTHCTFSVDERAVVVCSPK